MIRCAADAGASEPFGALARAVVDFRLWLIDRTGLRRIPALH
jgi:hypothetical protein